MPLLSSQTNIYAFNYLANSMVMSGDGGVVAFVATDGVSGTVQEVFVHDVITGITRSVAAIYPALRELETLEPALSANGSKIAFVIKSTGQVAVLNLADSSLEFATTGVGNVPVNGRSTAPALSADGRYVVFESIASNLVDGDKNGLPDIFVRDLQSGTTTRIEGTDAALSKPQISGDGQSVLFLDRGQLYLKNLVSGVTQLASSGSTSGQYGDGNVIGPFELSADGKYAVFAEHIPSVAHFDSRHGADVYRRDLAGGELKQVYAPSQLYVPGQFELGKTQPGDMLNVEPEVSSDASLVTYLRTSTFEPWVNWFIHDLATGDASQFVPESNWRGYRMGESSLSADGTHFGFVFNQSGIAYSPHRLEIFTVLRDAKAPGAGNQAIQGAVGVDTLTYPGSRSEYLIVHQSITDSQTARNGWDTLGDIERLHFDDGNIALDTAGVAGQAFRLYQAAFGRAPDQAGAGFWIQALDQGLSLRSMAEGFAASSEFQMVFGASPTNAQIVDHLYQNILHRAGDSAGIEYWTKVLDEGRASLPDVLIGFSESGENAAALLGTLRGGVPYLPFS